MQSVEAWRRRLLSKRYEHGLLEWELDDAAMEPDHTDQLLKSPMPGISALVCTAAEVSARQHTLASSGAVTSMPNSDGLAPQAAADESLPAASHPGAQGEVQHAGDCDAPPQLRDHSVGLQAERHTLQADVGVGKDLELQVGESELRHEAPINQRTRKAGNCTILAGTARFQIP